MQSTKTTFKCLPSAIRTRTFCSYERRRARRETRVHRLCGTANTTQPDLWPLRLHHSNLHFWSPDTFILRTAISDHICAVTFHNPGHYRMNPPCNTETLTSFHHIKGEIHLSTTLSNAGGNVPFIFRVHSVVGDLCPWGKSGHKESITAFHQEITAALLWTSQSDDVHLTM